MLIYFKLQMSTERPTSINCETIETKGIRLITLMIDILLHFSFIFVHSVICFFFFFFPFICFSVIFIYQEQNSNNLECLILVQMVSL